MSAQDSGRQSPTAEEQSDAQQAAPPSDGQGLNENSTNKTESENDLANLQSNPVGPLDEHAKETVSKEQVTKG